MMIVGEGFTDILLDENGQPVPDKNGEFSLVTEDECWKQDLRLETQTEEGELFYEDATGMERYGFGLADFIHAETGDFTAMEIQQRIKRKLDKRTYLDSRKTKQKVSFSNGAFTDNITISKQNEDEEYNLKLTAENVEVLI